MKSFCSAPTSPPLPLSHSGLPTFSAIIWTHGWPVAALGLTLNIASPRCTLRGCNLHISILPADTCPTGFSRGHYGSSWSRRSAYARQNCSATRK